MARVLLASAHMRWTLLLALVGCAGEPGGASVVLDVPNGVLDPTGYTSVEITLRTADVRDKGTSLTATVTDGVFDLGELAPQAGVSIEAVLRSDSGAAVGYGRTATPVDLASGETIAIPVRRPIVYIAGVTNEYVGELPRWSGMPATFSDLSSGTVLDGTTLVAEKPVLMIAAGPELYAIDQPVVPATGELTGAATIRAVSTGDHSMEAPIAGDLAGAVQDGAGSDDGATLVIATQEKLYAVDTRVPVVRELAAGNFARVAIVAGADGSVGAIAIANRGNSTTSTCSESAELWWIADARGADAGARMLAVGGFADIASDGGRAWYVDACKGELGEVTADGITGAPRSGLGRPTALAVSNGQAWLGIEARTPATLSLQVASIAYPDAPPRTLWSEVQEQVLAARQFPGVERRLPARIATFQQLELGTGGDYIAIGTSGRFEGARVDASNFPEMQLDIEELRVFDAASGGAVQRYQSWCDGFFEGVSGDILDWRCATTTGQTAPPPPGDLAHRVGSLTFLFGKK